jgi:hypothetical protein
MIAEIFQTFPAKLTRSAAGKEPSHAYSVAFAVNITSFTYICDNPDYLMSGYYR